MVNGQTIMPACNFVQYEEPDSHEYYPDTNPGDSARDCWNNRNGVIVAGAQSGKFVTIKLNDENVVCVLRSQTSLI